ncbi:MAG: ATP-grasp domain-containing protein [Proteobacteria bacterium]|nr:ATP-grasp domain-containing protein [Pseudomonadota bacterium]
MILLDKPYVSEYLKWRIAMHGIPVLDTPEARAALGPSPYLVPAERFAAMVRESGMPRLYANSENAIGWIAEHLADTDLPDRIDRFKNKVRFRELLRPLYPEYGFLAVEFDRLDEVDVSALSKPFIIKPAVGFFSLGVHKVDSDDQWPQTVAAIRAEVDGIRTQYPRQVLAVETFIIEENIPGAEYAVDVYWDDAGQPVILNILHHLFPDEHHLNDRVYVTSPDIVREHLSGFTALMGQLGHLAGLRNFPAHIELRLDDDGRIGLIEANPMRFAGWCVADMTWHAWGIDPYSAYLRDERPDWDALCARREGTVTSVTIADVAADVVSSEIRDVDYDAFTRHFSQPLELRRIDWTEYPVFAFMFARHIKGQQAELDSILHSDLKEYLRLG